MHYLAIKLRSQTASFRDPEFQNYHKSYALPPPTTVIGLVGAALGLSPQKAQDFFFENIFQLGCFAQSKGRTKDLWKYIAYKSKKPTSSIILRELHFQYEMVLVLGVEDQKVMSSLEKAFHRPVFALSLGNSDALVKVSDFQKPSQIESSQEIAHCWVDGNILNRVVEESFNQGEFSIYQTSSPVAYDMPLKFEFKNHEYGTRSLIERKTISIVAEPMKLNFQIEGIQAFEQFIPLINI